MRRHRGRGVLVVVGVTALLGAGCSSDPEPTIALAEVTTGEVVETVAAPATLEPRDRVVVSAPASGTVADLLVRDGDVVEEGDDLLRLAAPSVEQSIEQARAAVEAADALAGVQAGVDLSPLLDAVGGQLEAVVPDLLGALAQQVGALPEEEQEEAREALDRARDRYAEARARLAEAEQEAAATARSATASQRAAAAAQRRQAEVALEAARSRADDLLVTAPTDGVVELARGGGDGGGAGLDPEALEGLGGTGDASSPGGDIGSLLGGGGATTSGAGPLAEGAEVGAGQELLTVFDLGAFRVSGEVDELDVVDVEEGQRVTVLVEAFPDAELRGVVEHVAVEPRSGTAGGVTYPVTVRLVAVPDDVGLRVGLSGSVEIVTATVDAETVVPSSALRRRGETDVVHVAREGTIHEVTVTVEAIGQDEAAVQGELEVGEHVVVEGLDDVADGDPVPEDLATP